MNLSFDIIFIVQINQAHAEKILSLHYVIIIVIISNENDKYTFYQRENIIFNLSGIFKDKIVVKQLHRDLHNNNV